MEGDAERIEFDNKTGLVRFYNKARLRRLQGRQLQDEVSGALIVYDTVQETFQVQNAGGDNPSAPRISTVIQPRSKTQ